MGQSVPNLLKNDLDILFIGINPSLRSGEIGHHFAGRSNRFWKLLFESGLTPTKYDAIHDASLLDLNYGITNIIPRVTAAATELSTEEFRQGALILRQLLMDLHPRVAVYLGKMVYRYLTDTTNFNWGIQDKSTIEGVTDIVLPNPSGLNRMPIPEQLRFYQQLKDFKDKF